jgi:hypothetical protein
MEIDIRKAKATKKAVCVYIHERLLAKQQYALYNQNVIVEIRIINASI